MLMKKGRISNVLQRTFIFGSVAMLMTGFVFNSGNLSNADGTIASKVEKCALTSVTITAGEGETAVTSTYTGGLEPVIVGKDVNWTDYFCIRTISDVKHQESAACTAKTYFGDDEDKWTEHDHVSAYIYLPNYTGEEVIDRDLDVQIKEGDSGAWAEWINGYRQNEYDNNIYYETQVKDEYEESGYRIVKHGGVKLDETVGYYDVKFQPRYGIVDGESPTAIYVRFAKQYAITYNLEEGMIAEAEEVYTAGTEYTLPTPTKEGYYFAGWTGTGLTEPTKNVVIGKDATGDCSYTANWIEKKDITLCDITLKDGDSYEYTGTEVKPAVVVKDGEKVLVEGTDYMVAYANNVKVADKASSSVPTVTIQAKGDTYIGATKKTFAIDKGTLKVKLAPSASAITEGQKLSESALADGEVTNAQSKVIEGTFTWKDGNVVPTSTDSGVTKYTVVFTPTDANYKEIETTVVVTVNQKEQTPDPQPTPDPTPNPDPQPIITVGDNITDKDNKATYQVTKSAEGKVEVSYVAPNSKTKKVTIPATITLADGTVADVTTIAAGAFKKNTKIQEITIGKNVKSIGKEAFNGCKNLKKVKSAKNVTSIGKNAFANCTKLNSVAMSTKLTSIGEKAFYNCKALKKITIPKNVKSIGKSAFQNCKNLKNINIKTTKLTMKNVKKNAFKGIYSKAKIDVPNSKAKEYKKIFTSRGVGKKATIK